MSDKKKFSHAEAMVVAAPIWKLVHQKSEVGFCKIAGSLRRQKPMVSDIEILYVPQFTTEPDGLFDTKQINQVDVLLDGLIRDGVIEKRPNSLGGFTWGPLNKLAIHVESGIPIDFFATTKENWFVSLVIRTGSKETNLRLTMGAQKQGATLNAYGSGVTWSDGTSTPAESEEHVFEMCGVPFLPPNKR